MQLTPLISNLASPLLDCKMSHSMIKISVIAPQRGSEAFLVHRARVRAVC